MSCFYQANATHTAVAVCIAEPSRRSILMRSQSFCPHRASAHCMQVAFLSAQNRQACMPSRGRQSLPTAYCCDHLTRPLLLQLHGGQSLTVRASLHAWLLSAKPTAGLLALLPRGLCRHVARKTLQCGSDHQSGALTPREACGRSAWAISRQHPSLHC